MGNYPTHHVANDGAGLHRFVVAQAQIESLSKRPVVDLCPIVKLATVRGQQRVLVDSRLVRVKVAVRNAHVAEAVKCHRFHYAY